jgi:hypothetical protein
MIHQSHTSTTTDCGKRVSSLDFLLGSILRAVKGDVVRNFDVLYSPYCMTIPLSPLTFSTKTEERAGGDQYVQNILDHDLQNICSEHTDPH